MLLQLLSDSQSILVVDDEFDIVETIKIWLQKRGVVVQGFTDPLLALYSDLISERSTVSPMLKKFLLKYNCFC